MKKVLSTIATATAFIGFYATPALAEDPPVIRQSTTIPYTGGYGQYTPPPEAPHNQPPAAGGTVGVQYPPQSNTPTRVTCTRNGVVVPC